MNRLIKFNIFGSCKVWILILIAVQIFAAAEKLSAKTFICSQNPDYFSKRCTVHPYAITKVLDGKVVKGHLVTCQFKSFSCINGVCKDNYGHFEVPYPFALDNYKDFCSLLCTNPSCNDPLGWQ
ncbi:MAG: hypothetical protein RBR08_09525 [Desulforegulaceae bacterium]|nr:hypothetical protein [Desulforegulaceae bacterium]